jgi:hypothetical protein
VSGTETPQEARVHIELEGSIESTMVEGLWYATMPAWLPRCDTHVSAILVFVHVEHERGYVFAYLGGNGRFCRPFDLFADWWRLMVVGS